MRRMEQQTVKKLLADGKTPILRFEKDKNGRMYEIYEGEYAFMARERRSQERRRLRQLKEKKQKG